MNGLDEVVSIDLGLDRSCALRGDGTIWCWGSNYGGALGDGTVTDRHTPAQVQGLTHVTAFAYGKERGCALTEDKTILCWGGGTSSVIYDPETAPTPIDWNEASR